MRRKFLVVKSLRESSPLPLFPPMDIQRSVATLILKQGCDKSNPTQEHPFNRDGYRYVLAEPDPHAPFRQEFDESLEMAGKHLLRKH